MQVNVYFDGLYRLSFHHLDKSGKGLGIELFPSKFNIHDPDHEKSCLMPNANNKDADHLRIRAVRSEPLLLAT